MVDVFQPGTQIAYIPNHARGDIKHPDVEFGFVVSLGLGGVFCRYWSKSAPNILRTTATSELTYYEHLVLHKSHPQFEVDYIIEKINAGISPTDTTILCMDCNQPT
jgi:hypothetical protein